MRLLATNKTGKIIYDENGAVIVEASIALPIYLFVILAIYSIINICFVQAKMNVALDSTAQQLSQYAYIYYCAGLDNYAKNAASNAEAAKDSTKNALKGVGTLANGLTDGSVKLEDIEGAYTSIEELAETFSDNPQSFLWYMANEAANVGQAELAKVITRGFLGSNLKEKADDTPDAFLRRNYIKQSFKELDLSGTEFLPNGTTNIQLVVTYDVKVAQFFNLEVDIKLSSCAKTFAWARGVSMIKEGENNESDDKNETSEWDNPNQLERGKKIIADERAKYDYQDSGNGFDAYNPAGNQFITIFTIDAEASYYSSPDGVFKTLDKNYKATVDKVSKLDDDIVVKDKSGNEKTFNSDPDTRTYKLVVVIPDNCDKSVIEAGIKKFMDEHPGVDVEINTEHGGKTKTNENSEGES